MSLALPASFPLAPTPTPKKSPAAVYLASLSSDKSRNTQLSSLRRVLRIVDLPDDPLAFPWERLSFEHVQLVRARLSEKYAPATTNLSLVAIRRVQRCAWRMGLMTMEQYERAADVTSIKGSREPRGRHIAAHEIRDLFEACASRDLWMGSRNAALLSLLFGAGLRRAEAVAVRLDDLDMQTGAVTVIGKGNKERTSYLPEGALEAVRIWIATMRPLIRKPGGRLANGPEPDTSCVLLSAKYGTRGPMAESSVLYVVNQIAKRAGVRPFSPHDMRRTMIGEMLDVGIDISTVQRIVGHASPTTTSRYDRRDDTAKLRAASRLVVPYRA